MPLNVRSSADFSTEASQFIRGRKRSHSMNVWTRAHRILCGVCAVMGVAAMTSFVSADTGVSALRIACPEDSDRVEIEPFMAWGDGNSPYRQFGVEQANDPGILHDNGNWFYAYGVNNQQTLYAICQSKTRLLRVFVTNQREITVTERGRAVIDALLIGDAWDRWDAIYVLRSEKPNVWAECYGRRPEGSKPLRCPGFDPAKPKSRFLSEATAPAK